MKARRAPGYFSLIVQAHDSKVLGLIYFLLIADTTTQQANRV
jgi:hypothetical protein